MFFPLGHISLSRPVCYIVRGGALGVHQGGAPPLAGLRGCGGGVRDGAAQLAGSALALLYVLPALTSYAQSVPLQVPVPRWVCLDPVGLSSGLSWETESFSQGHNPHRCLQSEVVSLWFPVLPAPASPTGSVHRPLERLLRPATCHGPSYRSG